MGLCLGDGMPSDTVLKCQKYYKQILQVNLGIRWLSLDILEIANGVGLSYLVCAVNKPPEADTSLCLSQVSVEKVGTKGWLASLLSVVLPSAEETQVGRVWIIEPQKILTFGLAVTPFFLVP